MTKPLLILAGSASVHTWRYLQGIAPHVEQIYLVSNQLPPKIYIPENLSASLIVDFSLSAAWQTPQRIRAWLGRQCPWLLHKQDSTHKTILHTHQANSVSWHVLRAVKNMPLGRLLTCWGSDILLLPQRGFWQKRMVQYNLAEANWISSDSLYMASAARALLSRRETPISVLNFGIDQLPEAPDNLSRPWQILSCRLHKPLYRIDYILRAWAKIEAQNAPWQLSIAASGEQTEYLKNLAAELNLQRVNFCGFVDALQLNKLYRDSRVFISIPDSDSTSISLLEALAHGCLPLLSNLPANREWVLDGINGLICENLSANKLAACLQQALNSAKDNMRMDEIAALNRKIIQQKGLHSRNMCEFAAIYQQLNSAKYGE